jgi:GNAT superfamily N-acetyltransferase
MEADDVPAAQSAWFAALADLSQRMGSTISRGPGPPDQYRARLLHGLRTDPGGAWVAEKGGHLVGLAQAVRRDSLWVLSVLGLAPEAQGHGLGSELFKHALAYGDAGSPGLILSSLDPRAIRRYSLAGVQRERVRDWDRVRAGTDGDLELAAEIAQEIRGGRHSSDLSFLLQQTDTELLVVEERGFAVTQAGGPLIVAARDEDAARHLLRACLAKSHGEPVRVSWLTSEQQWAIEESLVVGLQLQSSGPVMVRADPGPLAPYVPSTPFA